MKPVKGVPLWLRRLHLAKAEIEAVRFPASAEEGLRECAALSALALRLLKETIGGDRKLGQFLARASAADAWRAQKWEANRARYFGR